MFRHLCFGALLMIVAWAGPARELSAADDAPPQRLLDALGEARRAGSQLAVLVTSDGCSFCDDLLAEFPRPQLDGLLAPAVLMVVHLKDDSGRYLEREFAVNGAPILLFLTPDSIEVDRVIGFGRPDVFQAEIKRIKAGLNTLPTLAAAFRASPTELNATTYLEKLLLSKPREALTMTETAKVTDPVLLDRLAFARARAHNILGDFSAELRVYRALLRSPQEELRHKAAHAGTFIISRVRPSSLGLAFLEEAELEVGLPESVKFALQRQKTFLGERTLVDGLDRSAAECGESMIRPRMVIADGVARRVATDQLLALATSVASRTDANPTDWLSLGRLLIIADRTTEARTWMVKVIEDPRGEVREEARIELASIDARAASR